MFRKLFDFFEKYIDKSKPILIGLSGGPDSLCLLYNLLEWGKAKIHVVHVDHGWRQESEQEALTLQKLASDLQVPFHTTLLQGLKGNLELASREARYEFFQKVAHQVGAEAIVLGHQADDVSETVLKRVLEGASFCTFGIPKVRKMGSLTLLRPLLSYTKEEIVTWLDKRGISYFSDPTNLQAKYLRGRMRSEIFPYLRENFGKNFEKSLCHLGQESAELYTFLEESAALYREKAIVGPWGTYFPEMPREAYLFKHLLKPGFSREQLDLAYEIIQMPNKEIHTKEKSIFIDRGRLFLTGKMSPNEWQITTRVVENSERPKNHFTDAWRGFLATYLPIDEYSFIPTRSVERSKAKAPAFLSTVVPAVVKDGVVFEDFLSGKKCAVEGPCLEIILSLQERN
ncbi:MAG: tRNA lysidine(34) synthetase TilS [Verrucomicrobia bacterium]|nr:tRNA lysidine(34) synthetase TilS [Verrucomicrobiota bacterium]